MEVGTQNLLKLEKKALYKIDLHKNYLNTFLMLYKLMAGNVYLREWWFQKCGQLLINQEILM